MTLTISRESADATLQRVALLSFLYYPEVQIHEPDYSLKDDVDFCMETLGALPDAKQRDLHQLFGQAIVNPSEYREAVFQALDGLVTAEPDEQ